LQQQTSGSANLFGRNSICLTGIELRGAAQGFALPGIGNLVVALHFQADQQFLCQRGTLRAGQV